MVVLVEADCILYQGHIGKEGYGLDYNPETQKTTLAHRLVFKNIYGYFPKIVMHLCNNKACVNPKHLKAGTQSENVIASYRDGLQVNPNRKLDTISVKHIYTSTFSQRLLAKYYGVTQKVIWGIKNGKTYVDITGHGGSCGV